MKAKKNVSLLFAHIILLLLSLNPGTVLTQSIPISSYTILIANVILLSLDMQLMAGDDTKVAVVDRVANPRLVGPAGETGLLLSPLRDMTN